MAENTQAYVELKHINKTFGNYNGIVLVMPRRCPDKTDTAPNSPMARAEQSTTPYRKAHLIWGNVIWVKI